MRKYLKQTKINFFTKQYCKKAVVNADSETGRIIARSSNIIKCATYGIDNPSNCFAFNIYQNLAICNFFVNAFDDIFEIKLKMGGEHNIYNALASIAALRLLNIDSESIKNGLNKFKSPSGRYS